MKMDPQEKERRLKKRKLKTRIDKLSTKALKAALLSVRDLKVLENAVWVGESYDEAA